MQQFQHSRARRKQRNNRFERYFIFDLAKVNRAAAFQINQNRAVRTTAPESKIINTENFNRRIGTTALPTNKFEQRISADRQVKL